MENRIAGVWVKASERLPDTGIKKNILINGEPNAGAYYPEEDWYKGQHFLINRGIVGLSEFHRILWLDESQPIPVNQDITETYNFSTMNQNNKILPDPEKRKDEICSCGVPLSQHSSTSCGWENANVIYFPHESTVPTKISAEENELRYMISTLPYGLKIAEKMFPIGATALYKHLAQQPIPVQEGLREDDILNILVWYQSKGDQYRNETELVNCVKDFLQVHPEKKEK